MALREYHRKRRFSITSEPRGKVGRTGKKLSFVVQRHAASHLHFDFRLELGGVLLSWAVPKGPSDDPSDKRLAVHVEDHPLEYGKFEGVIPKGQYGAGTVKRWDHGTWEPLGDAKESYRKGRLKFQLHGRRMRGAWTLVRMGGRAGQDGKNWLLIKERDAQAHRTTVPAGAKAGEPSARLAPQLATLSAKPPVGEDWLHEIKYDGYRMLAAFERGKVRLYTRNGNDWTAQLSPLVAALKGLKCKRAVLDGEVVVLDREGRSDFQALQNVLSEGRAEMLVFIAFDLLFQDGWDLRSCALVDRKRALQGLLDVSSLGSRVQFSEHIEGRGDVVLKRMCALHLEGVISKRRSDPYRSGRAGQWLKTKCIKEQEFVIGGYTDPSGARSDFGALLLGVQEKGGLRYVGRVGTGFTGASLRDIAAKLKPLAARHTPFHRPPTGQTARGVHWVRPRLVCEVAFTAWTTDGILRHPSFKGLREDKVAREVKIEIPDSRSQIPDLRSKIHDPRLTHPDKILYPDIRLTKQELADYYAMVGERILPWVADRPLALVRCPSGYDKHCFYQKHAGEGTPDAVHSGKEFVYVKDLKGVLALVQMGVLEIHPWGCRLADIERPDMMIFDLDPAPGALWSGVVNAARELRQRLKDLRLESFIKTSGGKGLHLVVPLKPKATWDEMKAFSHWVADSMAHDSPDKYTTKLNKAARGGRMFIDFLRNGRGSTAVAAYSTRARAGAPVSAPLRWEEVSAHIKADTFNVRNFSRRLEAAHDAWKGYASVRQDLVPALRKVVQGGSR